MLSCEPGNSGSMMRISTLHQSKLICSPLCHLLTLKYLIRYSSRMSTCSDPDRPDTDDENSQRSYSNASSPSASLQPTPNYVSQTNLLDEKVNQWYSDFTGSVCEWRSNNCCSESSALTLWSFPRPRQSSHLFPCSNLDDGRPLGLQEPHHLPLVKIVSVTETRAWLSLQQQ